MTKRFIIECQDEYTGAWGPYPCSNLGYFPTIQAAEAMCEALWPSRQGADYPVRIVMETREVVASWPTREHREKGGSA